MNVLLFTTQLSIIACRHMVPLYYTGKAIRIPDLAQRYGFKVRSLHPSFTALTKAGILKSKVGGRCEERGFTFAKDPKKITLYEIVSVLEGDSPFRCAGGLLKCYLASCEDCSIYKEQQLIVEYRKKILSLTTIYEHYKKMEI